MNWHQALQDYLVLRRALGYKLHSEGTALESFAAFMEQQHQDAISTELALAWATQPASVQPARWARRLSMVRGFARYCQALDSRSEIPPCELLPIQYSRPTPYLFTDDDIVHLLQGALELSLKDSLLNETLYCLFGLLSVSGLRVGEALNLTVDDVDLDTGMLTIRGAKFGKSRLIPLHHTTVSVLLNYKETRQKALAGRQLPFWFVNRQQGQLGYDCAKYHFNHLMTSIIANRETQQRRPHLHDLRHRFALSTLVRWYHDGHDVERSLPILSAYLGHVETRDTYWYLSASSGLMQAARARLEQHWELPS